MVFVFLFLTSLNILISRFILVAANGIISFFLWLSNISLYLYLYICIHTHTHTHTHTLTHIPNLLSMDI